MSRRILASVAERRSRDKLMMGFMGLGVWEVLIFLLVVVLLFGSTRLPTLARSFGQSIIEFKKGLKELGVSSDDDKSEP